MTSFDIVGYLSHKVKTAAAHRNSRYAAAVFYIIRIALVIALAVVPLP